MKYSFTSDERTTVLEFLSCKISGVSLNSFKQLLKKREIKINGERISQNIALNLGDNVEIFVPAAFLRNDITIVYEDENILIADKPPFSNVTDGLTGLLKSKYTYIAPVHRLDTNTRGLVVFAKNKIAEETLLTAFKERTLEKKYRALVKGIPKNGIHKAYLFKDEKRSMCYVADTIKTGYKEIITGCNIVKAYNNISEVELTLITGRTHQLRAHMKHIGCPIVGDDKYGDYALNKAAGVNIQQLIAVSIKFDSLPHPLEYLNGKKITIDSNFDRELIQKLEK